MKAFELTNELLKQCFPRHLDYELIRYFVRMICYLSELYKKNNMLKSL